MNLALDLDGTLITCESRQSTLLRAAMAAFGVRIDADRVWRLKRSGAATRDALLQTGLDAKMSQSISAFWQRMIEEPFWLAFDSLQPGVLGVLHEMRSMVSRLLLITARSRPEFLGQELLRLGIFDFFDEIVAVSPDNAIAAKRARLEGGPIRAFFGDSESDWHASAAAGVPFYAVASGQRSASFLTRVGIPRVFDELTSAWTGFLRVN